MGTVIGPHICSYVNSREHNGTATPHFLTAEEACERFGLRFNDLLWLCFRGMRFYELCNPTDVHPATVQFLDPDGEIRGTPLPRRAGLSTQLDEFRKPLSQLRFDTLQGYFWKPQATPPAYSAQLPSDYAVFSLMGSHTWEFRLSEKYSTGPEFIAEGAKRFDGRIAYSYGPEAGENGLKLSVYVDLNQTMLGFVTVEGQHFFPFDRDLMNLARRVEPGLRELEIIRLPILEGFCLHYLLFSGFSFKEMVRADRHIAKDLANKIKGFRTYLWYFFLFDPEDIEATLKGKEPISVLSATKQMKGRAEFARLKYIAQNTSFCAEYHAQKWLELKAASTDEMTRKLAETAALLLKGEPLKNIAGLVWKDKSGRPDKYVSDLRPKIARLAERHGLVMPPKSTRGAKKKKA